MAPSTRHKGVLEFGDPTARVESQGSGSLPATCDTSQGVAPGSMGVLATFASTTAAKPFCGMQPPPSVQKGQKESAGFF